MKFRFSVVVLLITLVWLLTMPVFANAAAPPDFTVLLKNAPADMTVTLITPDGADVSLDPLRRGWESCFRLYDYKIRQALGMTDSPTGDDLDVLLSASHLRFVSVSKELDFTVPMPEANQMKYHGLAVLSVDAENNTAIADGGSYMTFRNVLLVVLRVSVTLITEGIIFCLMEYRERRSWMIFFAVNLVTQTLLNLSVTGDYLARSYWQLGFVLGEALIFLAEALVYTLTLKEQSKVKALCTGLLANAVSLMTGWLLLAYLPL